MGLIVSEVYDALIEAGASPDTAKAAAGAVPPAENMATKEDIARLEGNMATKEDVARLEIRKTRDGHQGGLRKTEMATKEDFAKHAMATKEDFAKHEMATKEDFAKQGRLARRWLPRKTSRLPRRIEKKLAVLNFAMFTMGPVLVAFMVKLTFFP